jgi:hypothetical protein
MVAAQSVLHTTSPAVSVRLLTMDHRGPFDSVRRNRTGVPLLGHLHQLASSQTGLLEPRGLTAAPCSPKMSIGFITPEGPCKAFDALPLHCSVAHQAAQVSKNEYSAVNSFRMAEYSLFDTRVRASSEVNSLL